MKKILSYTQDTLICNSKLVSWVQSLLRELQTRVRGVYFLPIIVFQLFTTSAYAQAIEPTITPGATLTNSFPIVSIVEVNDPTNYTMSEITKKFYATHPDEYDLLAVFTDFTPIGLAQYSIKTKNDVQGIGQSIYDNDLYYGSNGKLMSIGHLGNANNYISSRASLALLEEAITHYFGIYIGGRQDSTNPLPVQNTQAPYHWTPCMSFDRYDPTQPLWKARYWEQNPDQTWNRVVEDTTKINKLDPYIMYFMGLLPPEKIPPVILLQPEGINKSKQCIDSFYSNTPLVATARSITIQEIINQHGQRIPAFRDAKRSFTIAYILAVAPATEPTSGIIGKIEIWANDFVNYFSVAVTPNAYPLADQPLATITPTATPVTASETPTPTSRLGDANGDGRVDGFDYVIWWQNFGRNVSGGPSQGDFNNSGFVDGYDYVIWWMNFGR